VKSYIESHVAHSVQSPDYGLDDPGLESWWGQEIFSSPKFPDSPWGSSQPTAERVLGPSPGLERSDRDRRE
jgi:hypothetical protein